MHILNEQQSVQINTTTKKPQGSTLLIFYFYLHRFSCEAISHNQCSADSWFAPSQWEMVLLFNDDSHWLGAKLELTLQCNICGSIGISAACVIKHHCDKIGLIFCSHTKLPFTNLLWKTSVLYSIQHLSLNFVVGSMSLDVNNWIKVIVISQSRKYLWLSAWLQYRQCVNNGDIAVLH